MRYIQLVPEAEKKEFRKVFNSYLKEISAFDETIEFEGGEPVYKWFDAYFSDFGRYPLYLKDDKKKIGFALVRMTGNRSFEIGEFYIYPEARRDGSSSWFASEIAKLFGGTIEFSTTNKNEIAKKFWDKFSKQFVHSSHEGKTRSEWRIESGL